jgi:hypothetical protein
MGEIAERFLDRSMVRSSVFCWDHGMPPPFRRKRPGPGKIATSLRRDTSTPGILKQAAMCRPTTQRSSAAIPSQYRLAVAIIAMMIGGPVRGRRRIRICKLSSGRLPGTGNESDGASCGIEICFKSCGDGTARRCAPVVRRFAPYVRPGCSARASDMHLPPARNSTCLKKSESARGAA